MPTNKWKKAFVVLVLAEALLALFLLWKCTTISNILLISGDSEVVVEGKESVHTEKIKKTRIVERSLSSTSCSCRGKTTDVKNSVEAAKLSAIMARRAEEYRKQQLRDTTDLGGMLISPPNSPLQYPSHGFTVHPLKKTLVPGLAVHVDGGKVFEVSLHAFHGVLTVEKVAPGQDVHRQNQSSLSIVATNLTALNDLLAQVTYSSAVYLLKTEDLVHFTFEDHEAIFPVTIERPSIPVLYDLGADINSQVTIVTKTFLRYRELKVLIQTIRAKYPDIRIIIADDSLKTENVVGHNVDQYLMPPAKGWFAGRNLAISQVTTKYFLWVDDDFLFLNETNLEMFVEIMESVPKLDVLGGSVVGGRFYFTLEHEDGEPGGDGGCLSRQMNGHYGTLPGFQDCVLVDGVVNFFLGRTDAVRRVGFDPMLQRVGHSEFFMDGLGRLLVASCAGLVIGHQKPRSNTAYGKFRHPGKSDVVHKLRLHYFKNHLKCVTY